MTNERRRRDNVASASARAFSRGVLLGMIAALAISLAFSARGQSSAADPAAGLTPAFSGAVIRVIDGDSLIVEDEAGAPRQVRLAGIDAPEMRQTCARPDGSTWPCGLAARRRLTEWATGRRVTCLTWPADRADRFGRDLCWLQRAGDAEAANAFMVRAGWALAFRRFLDGRPFADALIAAEADAIASRRGMHDSTVEAPWIWRERNRETRP